MSQSTPGIDIGATEFVLQQILTQRNRGSAILPISIELEELLSVIDGILVEFDDRPWRGPADPSHIESIGLLVAGRQER